MQCGPHNDLTDVPGIRVGQTTRLEPGWLTGCTVVLPDRPACAGVSVRGGGPGTRETDLLDPRNLVDRVDAIVLSGGSAFGLRVADGVMDWLYAAGRGWPTGPRPHERVPIVPAAILFDLGRGSAAPEDWLNHPTAADGWAACAAATTDPVDQGRVGAGTGARVGAMADGIGRPGGIGSASLILESGVTVAALVACNALGIPMGSEQAPTPLNVPDARAGRATTIGVVVTDANLTKAECAKLADIAHDGLARAIDPVHTAFDGDTFFALSTGDKPGPASPLDLIALQHAAATCVTRAIAHALNPSRNLC